MYTSFFFIFPSFFFSILQFNHKHYPTTLHDVCRGTLYGGPDPLSDSVVRQWDKTYNRYGSWPQTLTLSSDFVLCLMRIARARFLSHTTHSLTTHTTHNTLSHNTQQSYVAPCVMPVVECILNKALLVYTLLFVYLVSCTLYPLNWEIQMGKNRKRGGVGNWESNPHPLQSRVQLPPPES